MRSPGISPVLMPFVLVLGFIAAPFATAETGLATAGAVKLPLREYLELVETIEALERQAQVETEEATADLAAQNTSIVVDGEVAEIVSTFDVVLAGTPTFPVSLPYTGMAEEIKVEPRSGASRHRASLHRDDGKVVLYAPQPGGYTVTVHAREALSGGDGVYRLRLAASDAPVSSLELELPPEHEWSCDGAVLVEETKRDDGTSIHLAPARGREHVVEIRRRQVGRLEESALVSTSLVSIVEVRRGASLARQDIVHYEVLRGEVGTFELKLPAGLELDRVTTDEGDAVPLVDGRRLRVERRRRLASAASAEDGGQSTGHLVLTYRPRQLDGGVQPFPILEPSHAPRARYLVAASPVAADVRPQPEASWQLIDLGDLPESLRRDVGLLRPNAIWSLSDDTAAASLLASPMAEASSVGGVVWERDTMTLLTVDGSLVHRDRFVVEAAGTAFEVELAPGISL